MLQGGICPRPIGRSRQSAPRCSCSREPHTRSTWVGAGENIRLRAVGTTLLAGVAQNLPANKTIASRALGGQCDFDQALLTIAERGGFVYHDKRAPQDVE